MKQEKMRFILTKGQTYVDMAENARRSKLASAGDMRLIWVSESDLRSMTMNGEAEELSPKES